MLRLYNTLTRRLEPFTPIEPGRVRMYSCGPTVYRYIHIGNLRTFAMADWLRRTLEYFGYTVYHVKNITDVGHMRVERLDQGEDKLIAQARAEGKTSAEIAQFYTEAFFRDERAFRILPAHVFPRATAHVPEMLAIVESLVAKGIAYVVDGNVYFEVAKFPEYGALSGNALEGLLAGVRDETAPDKRHPEDFALWKLAEPGRDLAWDSPWGRGFPGWHIECSAMAIKYLGPRLDIHTGGVDNIFPHHEDERAQSEAYTGQRFVSYWVHAQHLLADGLKMAKSAGNAYTLSDIEARGFAPLDLRFLFAQAHYRSRLNFTFRALQAAQTGRRRLRAALAALAPAHPAAATASSPAAERWRERFRAALADDLHVPRALALVWDLARRPPAGLTSAERYALAREADAVLALGLTDVEAERGPAGLPAEVEALVAQRQEARHARDWARADALREAIRAAGYHVRDTRAGPWVVPRPADEGLCVISSANDVPDAAGLPDCHAFTVSLLAHNSRADLERCLISLAAHSADADLEVVIVDRGSTDDTLPYLRALARAGALPRPGGPGPLPVRVLFADHDLGFAAGRRASLRAARGRIVVWLDTAIELVGPVWGALAAALADPEVGLVGPYGLVTTDLREFHPADGPEVDAVEGYLLAFRRAIAPEIGPLDDRYRFYRMADVAWSFACKAAGYRVVALPALRALLVQHPHREWHALTPEERATKSKRNYDLFRARWHHGQSLLAANFQPGARWFGHDHPHHVHWGRQAADGPAHSHEHQHWPDHAHTHPHVHVTGGHRA